MAKVTHLFKSWVVYMSVLSSYIDTIVLSSEAVVEKNECGPYADHAEYPKKLAITKSLSSAVKGLSSMLSGEYESNALGHPIITDTGASDISSNPLSSRPYVTRCSGSPTYVACPSEGTIMTSCKLLLRKVTVAS